MALWRIVVRAGRDDPPGFGGTTQGFLWMNKAITDGLVLMPTPFSAGLNVWSRENGTAGSATWQGQANAAYVPADQDFGGCLEFVKTQSTQQLRYMGQTPFMPGMYLRVTARVKAISGNLPSVRIAAWAGTAGGANVAAADQLGEPVALSSYGRVVTVSAIIGSGNRSGVDMVWGTAPAYGHFGLDLTGPSGGVVRIDDIEIEDVTDVFHRKMMDWVDVRDFGAIGDGVTDDSAAFDAADAAANGRVVLVSAGTYYLGSHITFESEVRFEGTVVMPNEVRLALTRNFDLPSYANAFGDELAGFRKALQALFYFTDHVTLDLGGRRIELTEPINVAAIAGITGGFQQRRVLCNGQINVAAGTAWNTEVVTSQATYSIANPTQLTNVANVAQIPVGAVISGVGVGREVYVRSKNVGAGTVQLSLPLGATAGTRVYTFQRFKYMLDFSGFERLDKFEITDMEFNCGGDASAIMLAPAGITFRLADSVVNRPKDRGITSIGSGCQGIFLDQCQFISNEQAVPAQNRTTIAINVNANDTKLRANRVVRFAHFAVMHGSGHMVLGNHFFQGDDETAGVWRAGIVFTWTNVASTVSNNYIDNCFIEWSNERDPTPEHNNEYSFGGLSILGNICITSDVAPWFNWLVITPRGPGHFIHGLTVTGNTFRTFNVEIDRVEGVDTTHATLDHSRARNILFEGNTFNGITQITMNPVVFPYSQGTASDTWTVSPGAYFPFGGRARVVESLVAEGQITTGGVASTAMPYVLTERGAQANQIELKWPAASRGKVQMSVRMDNPL